MNAGLRTVLRARDIRLLVQSCQHHSLSARSFSTSLRIHAEKRKPNPFLKPTLEIRNDGGDHAEEEDRALREEIGAWLRERSQTKHPPIYDQTFPLENVRYVADVVEFETLAAQGKAGAAEAMVLLARSQKDVWDLPLEEQRIIASQVGAGRILEWILKTDPRFWDTILRLDLIDVLCWHLEAEGLGKSVVDWIQAWHTTPTLRDGAVKCHNPLHRDNAIRWPDRTSRSLLLSKLYWADDRTANSAIEYFLEICSGPIGQHLSFELLSLPLRKALVTDQSLPCSSQLFDRMVAVIRNGKGREAIIAGRGYWAFHHDQASDMLYHPTQATADPLLLLYRQEEVVSMILKLSDKLKWDSANQALRASFLLRLEGRDSDAMFMEEVSQTLHVKPWSMRRLLYQRVWSKDPKLVNMYARSPYARDLEALAAMKGGSWSRYQD